MTRSSLKRLSLRMVVQRGDAPAPPPDFAPAWIGVLDVEDPQPPRVPHSAPGGRPYGRADLLVRLHARPLGVLTVDLTHGPPAWQRLRPEIERRWGDTVAHHLTCDREPAAPVPDDDPWRGCVLRPLPSPPSVSVVVPTCGRPADLARCVNSLLATGYPHLEVLVVDNAAGERTVAESVAERYGADPRVRYLSEPTAGASRARNLGVRRADGEIVAFADDDVVVDRHWLAALAWALHERPDVDCVTGLVIPAALDTAVHLWFEQFGGFNRGYRRRTFDLAGQPGDTLLYPYTAGALGGLGNSAFRRAALRRPDAFDVRLGPGTPVFGAEDQDAFVALLRAGGRLLYEPAALVRHRHRDSYADLRWQVFTYGAGQTAAFTHWALGDRAVAGDLLRRAPAAVPVALGLRRPPVAAPPAVGSCPPELRWLERLGYLYGPLAYLRARVGRRRAGPRPATAASDQSGGSVG